MKQIFTIAASMIMVSVYSQTTKQEEITDSSFPKNEIKVNALSPLLFGAFEAGYERHLTKKSSLGVSFLKVFDAKKNEDMNYYISPYYRRYFGKKPSSGFFAEGFGMLSSIDGKKIYDTEEHLTFKENPDVIDLSLGLGVGWKWVSKKGIVIEANTGYGKLLFNPNKTDHTVTFKLGLNLGYRF